MTTNFSIAWSVVCLRYLTDLDAIWLVQLRGPVKHCDMGVPEHQGKGRFGGLNPEPKKLSTYDSPGGSTDQRFCFLRDHFCSLVCLCYSICCIGSDDGVIISTCVYTA